MRILAIETTDQTGTVAIAENDKVLAELELDHSQRSAQSLAPAITAVLNLGGWQPDKVQLVAVTVGPGSFTGLRVGVATAKVFAYAIGAEVLAIDTLETIASGAPKELRTLWAAMDAQRGDVVVRSFVRGGAGEPLTPQNPQELLSLDAWLDRLVPGCAVAGPVLKRIGNRLPEGVLTLDPHYWPPRARQVAWLAAMYYAAGRRDDLWKLAPAYVRRSAAEEKWEALGRPDGPA